MVGMNDQLQKLDPRKMSDPVQLQEALVLVINLLDQQTSLIEELRQENQALKDEINRLKGEHGDPKFPFTPKSKQPRPNTGPAKKKSGRGKNHKMGSSKKGKLKIHRTREVLPDLSTLPTDAVLKEYKNYIQQDVRFEACNTLYRVAIYHSVSQAKTYRAPMPTDFRGQFGRGIVAMIQLLHHFGDMTQGRLEALFESIGVLISSGTISKMITHQGEWALAEQSAILRAGIEHCPYTQIDGTKSVERGKKMVTQIIGSADFSVFMTLGAKSRLEVLRAIQGKPSQGLRVCWNDQSAEILGILQLGQCHRDFLRSLLIEGKVMLLTELEALLDASPFAGRPGLRRIIAQGLALSYYVEQTDFPVIDWLLSDDAGEYTRIARKGHALCWIHDARYYRKLIPRLAIHQEIHRRILKDYWAFYEQLRIFRLEPAQKQQQLKADLKQQFEEIFNQTTDYFQINACLARTYANKEKLLAVLDNPALPLHNNAAERGARRVVRKRDISLHTWSTKGTQIRDAYITIVETAAKLGVNAMSYIQDRLSLQPQMTALAELIAKRYQIISAH